MRVLNKRHWPYQSTIKNAHSLHPDELYKLVKERRNWCVENIRNHSWYNFGPVGSSFAFKDADDMLAFKLRWQ